MEAAFWSAERVTLVGSTTPSLIRSVYRLRRAADALYAGIAADVDLRVESWIESGSPESTIREVRGNDQNVKSITESSQST